jgi:hypothetical protein
MSTVYETFGPIEIPMEALKGSASTVAEARKEVFGNGKDDLGSRNGVFVFGLQTARGLGALYMGTSVRGFAKDVFRAENVKAYLDALKGYERVKAVLLLVARPSVRGRVAESEIAEIASTLFAMASVQSKDLRMLGQDPADWSIKGVLRSGPGRLSVSAMELRKILGTEA